MNNYYNYSIVIPYRDKYELFLKAIESIPDREDIQIIIVDNALQSLNEQQIPRKERAKVTYTTSSPVKGAGCARNMGLSRTEGKYLLFLDADDYFSKDAFVSFDRYLAQTYDIVFFNADSVFLKDGSQSNRHTHIDKQIKCYLETGNDGALRYGIVNPVAKLFNSSFILSNNIKFEETRVSNDVWFSMISGHYAKSIAADPAKVYIITEGDSGSSLTKKKDKENWFVRYQVMIRVNKFLRTVGKYQYHTRLSGFLIVALKEFGFKEFIRFLLYAIKNRASIF